jgi:hypothetical protein
MPRLRAPRPRQRHAGASSTPLLSRVATAVLRAARPRQRHASAWSAELLSKVAMGMQHLRQVLHASCARALAALRRGERRLIGRGMQCCFLALTFTREGGPVGRLHERKTPHAA